MYYTEEKLKTKIIIISYIYTCDVKYFKTSVESWKFEERKKCLCDPQSKIQNQFSYKKNL